MIPADDQFPKLAQPDEDAFEFLALPITAKESADLRRRLPSAMPVGADQLDAHPGQMPA